MNNDLHDRTMTEDAEKMKKVKMATKPILPISYLVAGYILWGLWGWLGILLAIPVGMIIGIILGGVVTRIIYTKK